MENFITTQTKCGQIRGIHCDGYDKYLGIRYASAERFAYAEPVEPLGRRLRCHPLRQCMSAEPHFLRTFRNPGTAFLSQ